MLRGGYIEPGHSKVLLRLCLATMLALTGFMGCGKSTVGALVAAQLGCGVVDSDEEFAGRAGVTPGEYVTRHGEDAFRRAEAHVVAGVLGRHRRDCPDVLALGGGAVTTPAVQQALAGFFVVYLRTSWEDICDRLAASEEAEVRPLFDPVSGRARFDQRLPVYEQVASVVVDTGAASPQDVADAVMRAAPSELTGGIPCAGVLVGSW